MKKSLLAMLLAVALVVPAFATEKGAMELNAKVGAVISPTVSGEFSGSSDTMDVNCDTTISLGVDFYYYVASQIALGVGVEHVFNSNVEKEKGMEGSVGNTSLFAQAKYVIDTGNDIFNNVYPMLQVGYGMFNFSDLPPFMDKENGLCWGVGFGTTVKENFIVELVYGINYGAVKNDSEGTKVDLQYKAFKVKVGYRFAI